MNTLETDLKVLKEVMVISEDALVFHNNRKADMTKAIAALEAQIAEEKKPKLRHGDYGINGDGSPCFFIKLNRVDDDVLKYCGDLAMQQLVDTPKSPCNTMELHYGNIIDEIKALQENVTSFELKKDIGETGKIVNVELIGKCVQFCDWGDKNVINVWLEPNTDFFKKMRQMEATYNRKEAKK